MGIIPINFQSLNPDSAQGINNQSVNANLPIESLPQGNLSAMGFNVVGNGLSQVVASNLNIVLNPTVTEITNGNLLDNSLGENISIVSINIQSQSYLVGNVINLQGIGNLTINANGDYYLLVDNINFSGALPIIDFTVANSNQSNNAIFSVFIDRLDTGVSFQGNDDYVAISQGNNTTGNLLDNDNGDNLFIESFSLSSLPGVIFLSGQTAQIQVYQQNNYMTVASIKIMANGNYYLTALNSIFNGNLPLITYVLKNNLGASATAKLSICINTSLNPPVLPASNAVLIPSQTPIPLPIPILVPLIPEPLPILQPVNLTLNQNEQISYNLLEDLFPNIQVDIFAINGQNFSVSSDTQVVNGVGEIKVLANGCLSFSPNNQNGLVSLWYRITNGYDSQSYEVIFLINTVFNIESDPFFSAVSYWSNGQSNFNDLTVQAATNGSFHNPYLEGNYQNNNIHSRYASLGSVHKGKTNLFADTFTIECFCKFVDTSGVLGWSDFITISQDYNFGQGMQVKLLESSPSNLIGQQGIITKLRRDQLNFDVSTNEWLHIALVLKIQATTANIKLFIGGVLIDTWIDGLQLSQIGTPTNSSGNAITAFSINKIKVTASFKQISYLRITKADRYTQNFNPLTESYLF